MNPFETENPASPATFVSRPAPGIKTSKDPIWVAVSDGIWLNTRAKQPWLYERPMIAGRATFKALGTVQLRHAKLELARRQILRAEGLEPTQKAVRTVPVTCGDALRAYQAAGYPDKRLNARPAGTLQMESVNCAMLLKFWANRVVESCGDRDCDDYRDWRIKKLKRKIAGTRTVDMDLNSLNNAVRYAKRKGLINANPFADRPRYHDPRQVRHCRECMPADANELHEKAALLFGHPRSVVLGFQFLIEAMTGLRTCEILQWGAGDVGTLTPDGKYVRVWRSKGQAHVNPFCVNHEGLQAVLKAHAYWKKLKFPDSPWFFPSAKNPSVPVGREALAHALGGLPGRKVTSHGCRAYFVTVRRSHGATDAQIAFEIGHTTGGATLAKVYGGVPPNWLTGDGPKLNWLPISRAVAWADGEKRDWNFRSA